MIALAAVDGASGNATTQFIIAILGAGGFGAIVAAIVTGLFSKKKLGAEAAEIISKAAAGVVTNLEAELTRQVKARESAQREHDAQMAKLAAAHVGEREEWRRVLQLHVAWDAIAIAKMAEFGVNLPPTPPLLPSTRHVDEEGYPLH